MFQINALADSISNHYQKYLYDVKLTFPKMNYLLISLDLGSLILILLLLFAIFRNLLPNVIIARIMIIHTIYNLLNNIFLLAFHITDLAVPNYIPAWLFRINYLILVLTATRFLRIFSVLSDKVNSREITITEIGLIICHLACYGNSYYKEYHGIPHNLSVIQ